MDICKGDKYFISATYISSFLLIYNHFFKCKKSVVSHSYVISFKEMTI